MFFYIPKFSSFPVIPFPSSKITLKRSKEWSRGSRDNAFLAHILWPRIRYNSQLLHRPGAISIHLYSTVWCMASSSSSLFRSIPISFPSTKQCALKSLRPSLRASATPMQKARFVARRKESVSVRQLQRPLSNVRAILINQYF